MNWIKRLVHFPFYIRQYRKAEAANRRDEWSIVVQELEQLHRRVPATRLTRALLGCAYVNSGENDKAVQQFEQIPRPLRDPDQNAAMRHNHAVALEKLGRTSDAAAVLEANMTDDWPDDRLQNAREYLSELKRVQPKSGN